MKTKLYSITCAFILSVITSIAQTEKPNSITLPKEASDDWYANAASYVKGLEYSFYKDGDGFHVSNSANLLGFTVDKQGYTAYPLEKIKTTGKWMIRLSPVSVGRDKAYFTFGQSLGFASDEKTLINKFGFADIEYHNTEKGLRQNFIINDQPKGKGDLRVTIKLESSLQARIVNGTKISFLDLASTDNAKMSYEDLVVWDAENRKLNARMELNKSGSILSLVVEDKDAVYPITIDPLNKVPEWTSSANGVLPSLLTNMNLQVQALYGYTVAGLGDINHDGFDDVAIGAPGMADVISGSGTILGVGAVFVYLGSATGLPAIPVRVLQPNTAVAGALFGFSIAAGNISPDGYPDIIVGAPLDSYQTTASGLLSDVSVNVTAGKVYVYRSEDLFASSTPSPFVQIRLQGNTYFNSGLLGLLNNISVKGLFGYAVGVTDDLNGDGREDIIIGCPAYVGTSVLAVESGAAFVYYSNDLASTTPVKLNLPTPTILGLVSLPAANLNGLLFGFSVDGVGDYNHDGYNDVVVGAPAGADLSSIGGIFTGQVLGGSAYVYYGTATGISKTIGATLQGSPSGLLSNAGNLFGFEVRGVRNILGARNGNILIGAPMGSVISNVVGGLRLKAGQLHVFRQKTSAFSSPVMSDQSISSSRSSSLLSSLAGQDLTVSSLYATSIDNMRDVNCDGISDIIVGEPLSTNVPLVGANVTGGAAYIYAGKPDGTYQALPGWSMYPEVSNLVGVNATSLIGYSVAGAGFTNGPATKMRAIIGGPSNTLDFGTGLLNLGNTVSTVSDFTFDNNGLGKSYIMQADLCLVTLPTKLGSFSGALNNSSVDLSWTTYEEIGVNMFELQRSSDRVNFSTIALVFAKNETNNNYSYTDKHPSTGTNYYRLKIVENDAKASFSNIISFNFGAGILTASMITLNPVRGDIQIKLNGMTNGSYYLKLYNLSGQLLKMQKVDVSESSQSVTMKQDRSFAKGIYSLQLTQSQGKPVTNIKLVIAD